MIKVSVCLASYNGEKYIKAQVESVLLQLSLDDELIISDNGSTDRTVEILNDFSTAKLKIVSCQKNDSKVVANLIKNFENAVKYANNEIIVFCDQDDIWYPGRIRKIKEVYALKGTGLVLCDAKVIDEEDNIIYSSFYEANKISISFMNLGRNPYLGCCLAVDLSTLSKMLPFPEVTPMHDILIGAYFQLFSNITIIEDQLVGYRRHGNNVSSASKSNFKVSYWKAAKHRVALIVSLIIIIGRNAIGRYT